MDPLNEHVGGGQQEAPRFRFGNGSVVADAEANPGTGGYFAGNSADKAEFTDLAEPHPLAPAAVALVGPAMPRRGAVRAFAAGFPSVAAGGGGG